MVLKHHDKHIMYSLLYYFNRTSMVLKRKQYKTKKAAIEDFNRTSMVLKPVKNLMIWVRI